MPKKIGEIGGFNLKAQSVVAYTSNSGGIQSQVQKIVFKLQNHGTYGVGDSLQTVENFINKGIEHDLAETEKLLSAKKFELAEIEKEIAKPFKYAKELRDAEMKFATIQAKINGKDTVIENSTVENVPAKTKNTNSSENEEEIVNDTEESEVENIESEEDTEDTEEEKEIVNDAGTKLSDNAKKVQQDKISRIEDTDDAKSLADNAIKVATDWRNDHVILDGFTPEMEQSLRNEIIKRQATTAVIGALDRRDQADRKSLDDLDKKINNASKKESDKNADTDETKKAAYKGAFTEDGHLKNAWIARQAFEEKINPLRSIPFINRETGIAAQISKKGVGKLVSDEALRKSIANGYTEQQHFEAASNIKELYENATLAETRADKNQQADVLSIKYFHCNTEVLGKNAVARIMAKEIFEHGHKLYTIELQELNKPAELMTSDGTKSPAGSKGSTHTSTSPTHVAPENLISDILPQAVENGNEDNADDKISGVTVEMKNGKPILKFEGKRVSKDNARDIENEEVRKVMNHLAKKFTEETGINVDDSYDFSSLFSRFEFRTDKSIKPDEIFEVKVKVGNGKTKDTIRFIRYVKENFDKFLPSTKFYTGSFNSYFNSRNEEKADNEDTKKALDELNAEENKYSKRDNIETKMDKILAPEELDNKQKATAEFAKKMGVPVIYFKGNKKFHGAHSNGITYINVDSETSHDWIFWHESFHWLAKNNPALFDEVAKAVNISQEQIDDYKREIGRQNLTDAEVIEEILADNMKDVASRAGLLQEVGKKNKSLVQRLISWFKSVMDKFTDFFNTPKNGLTREQKNKMYETFGKMARSLVDEDGNAIFRFNKRTKEIELSNGDALPQVQFSMRGNSKNVVKVTGDEFGDYADIKELRKKAINYYRENLQGTSVFNAELGRIDIDENGLVEFTGEGRDKVRSNSAQEDTLFLVKYLPSLISNSEKIAYKKAVSEKHIKAGDSFYYLQTQYKKGDKIIPLGITLKKLHTGDIHYYNHVINPDAKKAPVSPGTESSKEVNVSPAVGTFFNETISQNENNGNTKYSINNNDNSVAAFAKKIGHKFFGERNERIRKQMKEALEELTGYKISSGHLASENGNIAVKNNSKVIRTQSAYDWENILPEVGKLVAEKLKLTPTAEMNNYIADWIVDGAINNTSAESKEFQRAMQNADNEYREKLLDAQNKFIEWNNKSAMEKVQAIVSSERDQKSFGEKFKSNRQTLYDQFVEDIAPVKRLVDEIEKESGKKIPESLNPYVALRNYKGMAGRARMMLEGNEKAVKVLQETYKNIDFSNFKTLQMILDEVGASKDDKIYEEFKAYVTACHVKEIHDKNKQIDKAIEKRQEKIDAEEDLLNNATGKRQIAEIEKRIQFHKDKIAKLKESKYVTPFDEKTCDEIISKNKNRYGKSQKDLVHYSNIMLAIIQNSGIRSKTAYDELLKKWKDYVPLHRVFDENENLSYGDSLKTMEGSARDIIDPIQSIIASTNSFIKRAEKNKAKILLAGLVRCNGVGRLIEEVDGKKPDDHTTITFYEDGVKKYLQTDESVVYAVNNMTTPQMNWFAKFLRIGTNLLRNLVTVYNPNFAIRNMARDIQDAYVYSNGKNKSLIEAVTDIVQTPLYTIKGIMSVYHKDEDFNEWMIHGGAQASFWSMDRDYTQVSIDKLTRKQKKNLSMYQRIKDGGAQFLNLMSAFGEYSELGTRIGHYKKIKDILAKEHGGQNTYNDLVVAAYESRDLMDFARGGAASRSWNALTAFANANLQGIDKFCRTFNPAKLKTEEGRKEFGYSVLRLMISSVLPALFLFILNHDEDWYKNDLNDWERRSHWILGENFRVPKGMDFGVRFMSNLTEDALNWMYNNKPMEFKKTFIEPVFETLPDLCPTALQPIFESMANYDFFTKNPIVPRRLESLPEHLQYDDRTLGIAKYLGEVTDYSPKKIEHIITGFTGNMGKGFFRAADVVVGDKKASLPPIDWIPIVGGFFRIPYRNPKIINDYYEQLDNQTKLHNEFKATGKKPEGYNENLFNRFKKIQKEMQKFSKLERAAVENLNLDNEEKDRRQIAIQKKRIALVEKVMLK